MRSLPRIAHRLVVAVASAAVSLALLPATSPAVTLDWASVGDAGNAGQTLTYGGTAMTFGAVAESYRIMKHEVTIGQYAEFLNAAAKSDPYGLWTSEMETNQNIAGIARTGISGAYTYTVSGPAGVTPTGASSPANRPITYVSWFDAARFANWMQNGQGTGSTETGAYTLAGAPVGVAPARNPGAQYYLPTEDQWYKAAYYKGGSTNAGYWTYGTQSDSAPGNTLGSQANQANYLLNNKYSVTQSGIQSPTQNYLSDVGAYSSSASAYGTFDMSGNVFELNDLTGAASVSKGQRGGGIGSSAFTISSGARGQPFPDVQNGITGFRLAGPAGGTIVPEIDPQGFIPVATLVGGALAFLERRRSRGPRRV
ncbi:MAG: formylglycine-generating enzyme family protein [Planctomycetota bacterium]